MCRVELNMADEVKNLSSYTNIEGTEISYSRKDELGSGTFGTVHLGISEGKKVAIKKILKKFQPVKEDREVKNQLEAQGHENVVQIFETVQDLDFRYIVMELCAGTLWDVIEKTEKPYEGPPLPTDKQVMYQIADGLEYIHSQNVIHHDIKPENILISVTGQMKLSDFGLSKQSSKRDTCSWSGSRGTPLWMAPEMRRTDGTTKRRSSASMSDIFPCGCVFFVFLTRKNDWIHPFGDKKDPNKVILNIKKGKPINIKELNPDHFAFSFILEMIDRNPLKRISAKDVKTILEISISIEALFVRSNCSTDKGKLSSNLIKGPFKVKEHSLKKMGIYDARCGSFHPTDPIFACGLFNGQVLLLKNVDSTKGWEVQGIEPPKWGISKVSMKWNADGTKLAAGCLFGAVSIWSYPSYTLLAQCPTDFKNPTILWNPFNNNVLAAYQTSFGGCGVILISCPTFGTPIELESSSNFCCLDWISENKLACGSENGSIEFYEFNYLEGTSTRLDKRFEHNEAVRSIVWNEGSKQLASCSGDGCIKIWSCDSNTPVYSLSGLKYCRSLAWYPLGKCDETNGTRTVPEKIRIVCGLFNNDIAVWFPSEEQNPTRCLGGHSKKVLQVLFSPNGQFLASNGYTYGGEVIVWCTEDWEKIYTLPGHFWINSWNATSCKLVISDQMSQSGEKDVIVIEIGTDSKSEISAGRGRKRKNSE